MKQIAPSPWIDRLIGWSFDSSLGPLPRYAIATMLLVVVAVVRSAFVTDLLPWLLFVPVTLLIALLMGKGPGVYAALLSTILAGISLVDPARPLLLSFPQWVASALFLVVALGVVLLASELRAAFRRAHVLVQRLAALNEQLEQEEDERELLKGELEHRLKNLLSVVLAVTRQTLRSASDLKRAEEDIASRLAALASAGEVLSGSNWTGASLREIVIKALAAHNDGSGRITLAGPALRFDAKLALTLAITFHELATNAAKYGALANDVGTISIEWWTERGDERGELRFHLRWEEAGGPPVAPPQRRGFGSKVIERSMRAYFRGEAFTTYRPEGVLFSLEGILDKDLLADPSVGIEHIRGERDDPGPTTRPARDRLVEP